MLSTREQLAAIEAHPEQYPKGLRLELVVFLEPRQLVLLRARVQRELALERQPTHGDIGDWIAELVRADLVDEELGR